MVYEGCVSNSTHDTIQYDKFILPGKSFKRGGPEMSWESIPSTE